MFGGKVGYLTWWGGLVMTYDDDEAIELERLRSKRQRYSERMGSSQAATPAIKMTIGDWYVDELGVRTREITARE
jgi:hypothetical protein